MKLYDKGRAACLPPVGRARGAYRSGAVLLAALMTLASCQSDIQHVESLRLSPSQYGEALYFRAPADSEASTARGSYQSALAARFAQETPTTLYFAHGSAALDIGARDSLQEQARWMRQFPELVFVINGFSDPSGDARRNAQLATQRAESAKAYLVSQGVSASRLKTQMMPHDPAISEIVSFSAERRLRQTVTEVEGFAPQFNSEQEDQGNLRLAGILQRAVK